MNYDVQLVAGIVLRFELIIIIIIIIIINNNNNIVRIILVITVMQGIYNYIPETNHVYNVYSVAAVLCYTQCYFAREICFVLLH